MPFMAPILVGTAATAGGTAATAGLIGTAGAVTAGGVLTAAGAGLAGYSAIAGMQNAKDQAKAAKGLAQYDAKVKENENISKTQAGAVRAAAIRDRNVRLRSSMRASNAKSGVTSAGSPLLARLEAAEIGEMDALTTEHNARVSGNTSLSQAETFRMQGNVATKTGKTKAGTSLLGGAGSITQSYANYYSRA